MTPYARADHPSGRRWCARQAVIAARSTANTVRRRSAGEPAGRPRRHAARSRPGLLWWGSTVSTRWSPARCGLGLRRRGQAISGADWRLAACAVFVAAALAQSASPLPRTAPAAGAGRGWAPRPRPTAWVLGAHGRAGREIWERSGGRMLVPLRGRRWRWILPVPARGGRAPSREEPWIWLPR